MAVYEIWTMDGKTAVFNKRSVVADSLFDAYTYLECDGCSDCLLDLGATPYDEEEGYVRYADNKDICDKWVIDLLMADQRTITSGDLREWGSVVVALYVDNIVVFDYRVQIELDLPRLEALREDYTIYYANVDSVEDRATPVYIQEAISNSDDLVHEALAMWHYKVYPIAEQWNGTLY